MNKNEKPWLKIKNQSDTEAEMYISGDIVGDDVGGCIESWGESSTGYNWPADIKRQLDEVGDKNLTIYINSGGGSVMAGMAMANMVKRCKGQTTAIVDGYCCSIATQILFAADKCKVPKNAYVMIHKPSTYACGDSNDLQKCIEQLDTVQAGIESTYVDAARDGITPEQVHEMVEAETWLTGEQAAEYFNIELLDAVDVAAYAGDTKKLFKHAPDGLHFADGPILFPENGEHNNPNLLNNEQVEAAKQAADKLNSQRAQIALALAEEAMNV
jgi:ATP-dependent protease ClpP protease subunit